VQFSPYGLLLLIQPLHSSEQHIRANLEFSSNFAQAIPIWLLICQSNLENLFRQFA
jgi:hypothetical protein